MFSRLFQCSFSVTSSEARDTECVFAAAFQARDSAPAGGLLHPTHPMFCHAGDSLPTALREAPVRAGLSDPGRVEARLDDAARLSKAGARRRRRVATVFLLTQWLCRVYSHDTSTVRCEERVCHMHATPHAPHSSTSTQILGRSSTPTIPRFRVAAKILGVWVGGKLRTTVLVPSMPMDAKQSACSSERRDAVTGHEKSTSRNGAPSVLVQQELMGVFPGEDASTPSGRWQRATRQLSKHLDPTSRVRFTANKAEYRKSPTWMPRCACLFTVKCAAAQFLLAALAAERHRWVEVSAFESASACWPFALKNTR